MPTSTAKIEIPLNPIQIIADKRDGRELTADQIRYLVRSYHSGTIPDYQMSAWSMAVLLNGMSDDETAILTDEILASGTRLEWPDDGIFRVDKHSTGGVGDKVSLILAPLLACCDVQVPMLSGRGLGPTGGTLDKLESFPGFRTDLSLEEIRSLTQSVGCVITGASPELAPVDKRLYALRDVSGTVPSLPLIVSSIMSKKLAESPDALILDVKVGNGAFMQSMEDARRLADSLVATGRRMNVKTTALLTDMNQPLGRMIGNCLEVRESIDVLRNSGPADVRELTLELGARLLELIRSEPVIDLREQLESHLASGRALEKFREMIAAQNGDIDGLVQPANVRDVVGLDEGFVTHIDTQALGFATIDLGGGRRVQSDAIDYSVGLEMCVRLGDRISANDVLIKVYGESQTASAAEFDQTLRDAITISNEAVQPAPLIYSSDV